MKLLLPATVCLAISLSSAFVRAADAKKGADKAVAKKQAAAKDSKPFVLPDSVAVVEGITINKTALEEALDAALAQAGKKPADISVEEKKQAYRSILDELILDKLVLKRAEKETVTDAEFEENFKKIRAQFPSEEQMNAEIAQSGQTLDKLKENIRTSLKQQKWVEAQIAGKTDVADADAQKFYDGNPESFKMPEMVRASHILIAVPEGAKPEEVTDKEKKAREIDARVKKGEAFDKVAGEVSDDPGSKAAGGDLNFFSRDRMVPEFADAAFKMKKDEISEPVKSKFGFHIIKVTDRKDARTVPFPEAKEKIVAYLKEQKRRTAVETVITELRAKADVKVNLPE